MFKTFKRDDAYTCTAVLKDNWLNCNYKDQCPARLPNIKLPRNLQMELRDFEYLGPTRLFPKKIDEIDRERHDYREQFEMFKPLWFTSFSLSENLSYSASKAKCILEGLGGKLTEIENSFYLITNKGLI